MTEYERRNLKKQRRLAKQCLDCGSPTLSVTVDGKPSIRCDVCRPLQKRVRSAPNKGPHVHTRAKPRLIEADEIEFDNHLDSPQYLAYCIDVAEAVKNVPRATIRAIKEYLGEKCIVDWLFDALATLETAGEIVCVRDVCISVWEWEGASKVPYQSPGRWNGSITPAGVPRPDTGVIYGEEFAQ